MNYSWHYLCFLFCVFCLTFANQNQKSGTKSTRDSRKLFGGYRITPKFCKSTRTPSNPPGGPNVCMFNHECSQRNGVVVGACMDGFLFGACCQLPKGVMVGDFLDQDLPLVTALDNTLSSKISPTTPRTTSMYLDITSNGVSQIAASLLNSGNPPFSGNGDGSVLPTGQDNSVVLSGGSSWSTAGVTHPEQVETVLDDEDNDIIPSYFRPTKQPMDNHKISTPYGDQTTMRYADIYQPPILEISVSNAPIGYTPLPTIQKPFFRPKPPKPTDENYILIPTITHDASKPNKTEEFDSIVNILSMLNQTTTGQPLSTFSYVSSSQPSSRRPAQSTRKPPSTSYVFSTTVPPRRTEPTTNKKTTLTTKYSKKPTKTSLSSIKNSLVTSYKPPSTSYVYSSTFKPTKKPNPPSTSYVYSNTFNPTRKPKPPSTSYVSSTSSKPSASSQKPPSTSYVYSSTFRPTTLGHSTFANSPDAFPGSHSTSSYGSTYHPTRRPGSTVSSSIAGPGFTVTSQPLGQYSPFPSPAPTLIVLGPAEDNYVLASSSSGAPSTSTVPTRIQSTASRPQISGLPQRKPINHVTINNHVTQNIYSTQRPPTSSSGQGVPSPTVIITPKPTISSSYPSVSQEDEDSIVITSNNDENNFPPDRNPNLNISVPSFSDEDITTPNFIEDEAMNEKVESFVNQIIYGLQEPFNDLKNIVYNKHTNASTLSASSSASTTKKPVKKQGTTTKKPGVKPNAPKTTTRKPVTTRRPIGISAVPTRRQTTTSKRPVTTKKVVVTTQNLIETDTDEEQQIYRDQCGVRPLVKTGRIVGGKGAVFGEFPWQVLVRESTWLGLFTKNKCGGVLISDKYVMTAAHCQPGFLASLVAVFGEFDISGDLETRKPISRNVKRVIVHRKYDAATFENDLALLELESPVKFDAHIIPICLPRENEDFTGRVATVTGWGRLKYGGGVPSVLQEVQVPIMENHVCQEMFRTAGHSKVIMESFLCAGYANGQKDSCEGDSGGPLVLQRPDNRYQLAGTVSHGIKCAAPYLPGVYMRTTFFKPWISSITGIP